MNLHTKKAIIIGGGIAGPALAIALRRTGMDVDVFEARSASSEAEGAFLNLAPNGVSALQALGAADCLAEYGFHSDALRFYNGRGKRIGEIDSRSERKRYGAENMMTKRADLQQVLREEAERRGAEFMFRKRLTGVDVDADGYVTAYFDDGTSAEGNVLLGCDGIHSRVRRYVLPASPEPEYTGIVDCGGYAHLDANAVTPCIQHMTFGRRAFFGYIAKPDGEVWWFSNIPWPEQPERGELDAITDDDWRDRLLDLHGDDPAPIPEILRSACAITGKWPQYAMPPLPRWHDGPVCLLGDAAHATPPHVGQGASLAIEDAVVLAKCLRDLPDVDCAFAAFQRLRKERVERLVQLARRTGNQKVPGPVAATFRDLLLPLFLKAGAKQAAETYAYTVDWDEKAAA